MSFLAEEVIQVIEIHDYRISKMFFMTLQLSFDWRKILEVLILGQFVVDKVLFSLAQNLECNTAPESISSSCVGYSVLCKVFASGDGHKEGVIKFSLRVLFCT